MTRNAIPIVLVVLGILTVVGAGAALAADGGSVVLGIEPDEAAGDPGETVTVDLTINTQGNLIGDGVNHYEFTLVYHPAYLTVTDVEHSDYIEATGYEAEVTEERETGELHISHRIADREEGVRGSGIVATVTFEVAETADPADVRLEYVDPAGTYIGDHPAPTYTYEGLIAIDGGGEEVTYEDWTEGDENGNENDDDGGADDHPGPSDDGTGGDDHHAQDDTGDDGVGVITPDDVDRDLDVGEDEDPSDEEEEEPSGDEVDDALPWFGPGAIVGVLVAAFVIGRRRR